MRSHVAFAIGVVIGGSAACAALLAFRSHEAARFAVEISAMKQDLSRADEVRQHDREALRTAHKDIQAIREPTPQMAPVEAGFRSAPNSLPGESAIMRYLGDPVPAPAMLDPKYSAKELGAVFQDLCDTLGIKVEKLAVDTTEFPFIVCGVVEKEKGSEFFRRIDSELRALPGYTYGGSVTGRISNGATYFALNMVPSSAYPGEYSEAIRRRLVLRLQMAAAACTDAVR